MGSRSQCVKMEGTLLNKKKERRLIDRGRASRDQQGWSTILKPQAGARVSKSHQRRRQTLVFQAISLHIRSTLKRLVAPAATTAGFRQIGLRVHLSEL